jgi:cation:H+ antiporter
VFESLSSSIAAFAMAAIVIAVCGVGLSITADRLADRTGWGEALLGGLLLAGVTSLPDFAATLTAAADGFASLAMGNILGSLAVNLAFLGVGDLVYRRANLEHAAASSSNLLQAALLIPLLLMPLLAMTTPEVDFWGVHPASPLLLLAYLYGYRMVRQNQRVPMWRPTRTAQTVKDDPDAEARPGESLPGLWLLFGALAIVTGVSGWILMNAAETIVATTPLSETVVGTLFTAVFTSMPELVTTIAAIRYGALTLAVSNIIGTNCFNVVVIAVADVTYRDGSIYHAVTGQHLLWLTLATLMASILLLGLLRRERYGIGRIGFESFLILMIYLAAAVSLPFWDR